MGLSSLALSDADVLYASLPSFKKPNDIPTGMTTPKTSLLLAHCRLQTLQYCTELLAQAVSKIEGLEGCPCLEQLWLNENEIKAIQGLDLCPQLRRLYLYSNRITAIQGLGALHKLEVRIAGLSHVLHQCIDVAKPGLLMFELDLHCSFLGCASGTACIGIVQPQPLILSIRESLGPQERPLVACTRFRLVANVHKSTMPFLASHVMNYLEVWRAVREPTVLPVCVKSRHGILCKTVCRYFGWLTTRSAT